MVLLLSAAVSPVCAAAEEFSGFYALGNLGVRPKAGQRNHCRIKVQRSKEAPGSLAYPITCRLTAEETMFDIMMEQTRRTGC